MALNDVRVVRGQGGLGRLAPNQDGESALWWQAAAPASWAGDTVRRFTSLAAVEQTITQTNAATAIVWYQCREFFRVNPSGVLWLCISANATVLDTLYTRSNGSVRLLAMPVANLAAVQSVAQAQANSWRARHAPITILAYLTAALTAAATDGRTLNSPDVAVVMFESATGLAPGLKTAAGLTHLSAIGAVLGLTSKLKVSESVGWVEKGNLSDGSELETVNFGGIAADDVEALDTKGYLVARKHVGISGTYINDGHVCNVATSDYAFLEISRTVNKAQRLARQVLLPRLGSPLLLDPETGFLSDGTCREFETLVETVIVANMQANSEVTGVAAFVDPEQDVVATGVLEMALTIVIAGVARNITLTIGLATKI